MSMVYNIITSLFAVAVALSIFCYYSSFCSKNDYDNFQTLHFNFYASGTIVFFLLLAQSSLAHYINVI